MNLPSITLAALICCLLLACQPNGNGGRNPQPLTTGEMTVSDTARYKPLYVHPLLSDAELNAKNTALGGFGKLLPQPMERMEAQLLTRTYWVMEFYHDGHASKEQRKRGQGQWFKFSPDGSFTGGHWDRQTHSGAWYLIYEGPEVYLIIDSNVDRLDARWHVQAIANERDAMAWVRTAELGPYIPGSVSVKLIELYDVPTREQFGVASE